MNRRYNSGAIRTEELCGYRTLYVVDVENMACSCAPSTLDVAKIRNRIYSAVQPKGTDHSVVATSHHNAPAAYFGWASSAQRLARSGKDGADNALLEVLEDVEWVASHYARVVLASGDHIFAQAVAALKARGLNVIVIPPDRGFSTQLRVAAGPDVVRLGPSISSTVIARLIRKDAA